MTVFSQQSTFLGVGNVNSALADTNLFTASTATGTFVVLVDEANKVVASASNASITGNLPIRFLVRKSDGTLKTSAWFRYNDIISGSKKYAAFSAPVEQVSYLGANAAGTIGGLGTITAGNNYIATVTLKHSQTDTNNTPLIKQFATQAITGDTQKTIAKALWESANRVLNRGLAQPMITVERIAAGSGGTSVAVLTGTSTICKFTNGSKTVAVYVKAADGTAGLTASTASVTSGNVLNVPSVNGRSFSFTAVALGSGAGHTLVVIGETTYLVADAGTDAQNATAIAAAINAGTQATAAVSTSTKVTITYNKDFVALPPMVLSSDDDSTWSAVAVTIASGEAKAVKYVVDATATTAATFQLDEPWQGATGYVYEGTTEATNVGITTLTTSELWGLKLTGIAQPFNAITGKYQKVRFEVMPESNTNVPINLYTGTAYSVMQGFDTAVTYGQAQSASEGVGTYESVAEQESLSQWGRKGNTQLQAYPPTVYTFDSIAGYDYGLLSFTVKNTINDTPGVQPATFENFTLAIQKDQFDSGEDGNDIATALSISLS